MSLQTIKTPALLLDLGRVRDNAERMTGIIRKLNTKLRPHVKTHKCLEVARLQTKGHSGAITVSTLAEAGAFAANGFSDILYAVPVEPGKFTEICETARTCEKFSLITDDAEIPRVLNEAAKQAGMWLDVFLKVDCGYHRCGVLRDSPEVLEITRRISDSKNLRFAGILTHAGHSYHASTEAERFAIACNERDVMTSLADNLKDNGFGKSPSSASAPPRRLHALTISKVSRKLDPETTFSSTLFRRPLEAVPLKTAPSWF